MLPIEECSLGISESMKVAKACQQCRTAKRRCTTAHPQHSGCLQCLKRHNECSLRSTHYAPCQKPVLLSRPSNSDTAAGLILLPPQQVEDDVRDELVDIYLQLIHDKPHTLFHPYVLRKCIQEHSCPDVILYSIMALAAR